MGARDSPEEARWAGRAGPASLAPGERHPRRPSRQALSEARGQGPHPCAELAGAVLLREVQALLEGPGEGPRCVECVPSRVYFPRCTPRQESERELFSFQLLFNASDCSRSKSHFAARSPLTPLSPCLSCHVLSLTEREGRPPAQNSEQMTISS